MSYCLNPHCPQPQNPEGINCCQTCSSKLLLKERYRAVKIIGQGGFGTTFLALDEDKPSHPPCVIKRFLAQKTTTSHGIKAAKLFAQEAVQLEKLGKHDQIPELLAYFQQNNQHYLVQEFIDGENLSFELAEEGTFKETQTRQLLNSLLPVLQFVHCHQVIHRDIKPTNIIRRRQDGQLVMVDFGAAKFATGMMSLKQGTVIGTPQYAAPEQARGQAKLASDLYSLGVTCLHLLTQLEPFDLFNTAESVWVWRDYLPTPVSDSLGQVLDKMIHKDLRSRYQSAAEVMQALNPGVVISLTSTLSMPSGETSQAEAILPEVSPLQPAHIEGKFGYQDSQGRVVIEPQFDEVSDFQEGLAKVRLADNYAYINQTGELVSEMFPEARHFSEGLAAVKLPHKALGLVPWGCKWGYVDSNGEVVIESKFDLAGDFTEGLGLVKIGHKYGYIDTTGEIVVAPQFDGAKCFCGGLAQVKIGRKYSYIDKTGRLVSQMFDGVGDFSQGLAVVKLNNLYGYVDTSGKLIIAPQFTDGKGFCEGLAAVKVGNKYGYIDTSKQMLIPPQFNDAKNFSEGLAAVHVPWQLLRFSVGLGIGAKWGYIDVTGEVVITPQFQLAESFIEGQARVKLEGQERYINNQGELV